VSAGPNLKSLKKIKFIYVLTVFHFPYFIDRDVRTVSDGPTEQRQILRQTEGSVIDMKVPLWTVSVRDWRWIFAYTWDRTVDVGRFSLLSGRPLSFMTTRKFPAYCC